MNIQRNLRIAFLLTVATTVLFGFIYPLAITGIAQVFMKNKANGQLIVHDGTVVGSRIIGQPFTGPMYFNSRPSAAGNGYDAANSSASNRGPTNRALVNRVESSVKAWHQENPSTPVPVDLVTASASGLDPDITPAAAEYQAPIVARARGLSETQVQQLIAKYTQGRQFGFLGEPRVNVLELNLALDRLSHNETAGLLPQAKNN